VYADDHATLVTVSPTPTYAPIAGWGTKPGAACPPSPHDSRQVTARATPTGKSFVVTDISNAYGALSELGLDGHLKLIEPCIDSVGGPTKDGRVAYDPRTTPGTAHAPVHVHAEGTETSADVVIADFPSFRGLAFSDDGAFVEVAAQAAAWAIAFAPA